MYRAFVSRILIFFLPLIVFPGCMNHDPPVSKELIYQTPLYVKYGDSTIIDATSGYPIQFTVLDTYFAELTSTNYLFGKRVGETKLSVESNGTEGFIRVVVMPKYGFFPDPVLDFSLTRQHLMKELTVFSNVGIREFGEEVVAYRHPHDVMRTRYFFEGDSIVAIRVLTGIKNVIGVYQTIEERYKFLDYVDGTRFYINKATMEEATIVVGVLHDYDEEYAMIIYFPVRQDPVDEESMMRLKSYRLNH